MALLAVFRTWQNFKSPTRALNPSRRQVLAGERLTSEDGLALFQSHDLLAIGWLANHVREKRHGNIVLFQCQPAHQSRPTFASRTASSAPSAARRTSPAPTPCALDEVYARGAEGVAEGATEFHIVGGLHPDLPFDYYLDLIRGLKQRFPQVHLKAFTMVEVHYYARLSKLSIHDTLLKMKEAGVDSLPGGGAEIFHPRVRRIICDHKVSGTMWLIDRAHGARNRPALERHHAFRPRGNCSKSASITWCACAKRRTRRTASWPSFLWNFIPTIPASRTFPKPTGMDALKTIAVSRLMLDNFDHIKAYWIMLTPRIAQIALDSARTIWTARSSRKISITTPAPPRPKA